MIVNNRASTEFDGITLEVIDFWFNYYYVSFLFIRWLTSWVFHCKNANPSIILFKWWTKWKRWLNRMWFWQNFNFDPCSRKQAKCYFNVGSIIFFSYLIFRFSLFIFVSLFPLMQDILNLTAGYSMVQFWINDVTKFV